MQLLGRKKMSWKFIIVMVMSLVLSGCAFTNLFLFRGGESGDRSTLPVRLETLIEMAEYCKIIYSEKGIIPDDPENANYNLMIGTEFRKKRDEFSYHVKQTDGVSILVFR